MVNSTADHISKCRGSWRRRSILNESLFKFTYIIWVDSAVAAAAAALMQRCIKAATATTISLETDTDPKGKCENVGTS